MTERIDHVADATDLLNAGGEQLGVDEFAYADLAFKSAQVYATLALVEQQRIANLIAISQFDHKVEDARLYTTIRAASEWRNEAALALGLTEPS